MPYPVPALGSAAPDFTLETTSGEKVTLSGFRGKQPVLVAFFPLAFTSTCTAELCAMTDEWSAFEGSGAVVIPISVDAVPSLREYKAKYAMKVDLASDFRRDAARAYGVLNDEKYYANRSYFLVDREGILRWSHIEGRNGDRRQNAELLAEIEKLRA